MAWHSRSNRSRDARSRFGVASTFTATVRRNAGWSAR